MLIDLGKLSIFSTPICSKYRVSGLVEGFYSKEDIIKVLKENNINNDIDFLENQSKECLIWDKSGNDYISEMKFYVDIDNKIIEANVKLYPHKYDISVLNTELKGISGLKLINDVEDKIFQSDIFKEELDKFNSTIDGQIRSKIDEEVGDIVILTDKIDFIVKDGIQEAAIPVGLGDLNWQSPVVIAKVRVTNEGIDISDIEDKINHLLLAEDMPEKIVEKVKKKSRIKYRRFQNNGDSFAKKPKNPTKKTINRGHQ